MALTKRTEIDKIEIVGEYKSIQIREAVVISENGIELSRSFHRYALSPDADLTDQPADVVSLSNIFWTDEIKAAYQASLEIVG
jgi:hypothetical protein|tara:strand:+ start:401 stop:649 length:249 start_codon:yes stop_codon:yes gene_type:complete